MAIYGEAAYDAARIAGAYTAGNYIWNNGARHTVDGLAAAYQAFEHWVEMDD